MQYVSRPKGVSVKDIDWVTDIDIISILANAISTHLSSCTTYNQQIDQNLTEVVFIAKASEYMEAESHLVAVSIPRRSYAIIVVCLSFRGRSFCFSLCTISAKNNQPISLKLMNAYQSEELINFWW